MDLSWIKDKGKTIPHRLNPIYAKIAAQKKFNERAKQDYMAETPNIFIGRYGYPNINVGFLNAQDYNEHDNVKHWKEQAFSIPKIIDMRTNLINAPFKNQIKSFNNKLIEMAQEVSQASKPIDIEVNLTKKPKFSLSFNQKAAPHGPNVKFKKVQITENVNVKRHIDKVVSDTDLKAADALTYLYKKGYDEHALIKLISVGNLGIKPQRKLVPTRWSITATDDILGKNLINQIKDYQWYDYAAYFGSYLGNYYLVLCFPDAWEYEIFETITVEDAAFSTDYEPYEGRKKYAFDVTGGYYTVRLAILEKLKQLKRQASVLTLRFINPAEYIAPLGVWVTRESARNAMEDKPLIFGSMELMLTYVRHFVKKKFNMDVNKILNRSILLKNRNKQKKLTEF